MILQALTQYYEDLVKQERIARPGWAIQKISYALCIGEGGQLEQVIPLLEEIEGKKPQPRRFSLPAPIKRTVGIAPNFLWDNSSYLLGIDMKGKPERSRRCFDACRAFHHALLDGINSPAAESILRFFDCWQPEEAEQHPALRDSMDEITAGAYLLFRVNGIYAHEDELIRQAWQNAYEQVNGELQQCLVTGNTDVIEAVHPSIKGVDGAQSSGAAIVSFNAPAFCSYGQEQSYNAPVGKYAAFAYTAALNYLLADRENVQKIGDTTVVCWAEGGERQYQALTFAAIFGKQDADLSEADLRDAVRKLADGKPVPERKLDPQRSFYILGLSPNAARLSVRFFYRDTFGNLMKNVNAHHERMEIVRPAYDSFAAIPLWAMLKETVNPNSRDKSASPVLAGAVARAVFTGGLYPAALLEQTMLRIRAERDITRGKAAIIKAYYLRKHQHQSQLSVQEGAMEKELNESCDYNPYLLGRLFAVMEKIQIASVGGEKDINRTIKDSYFNAAATTPNMAFQKLFSLSEYHMRKLKRDYPGKAFNLSREKCSIIEKITKGIPARFTADESNAFYLGYYHQTQKRYGKKEDK